MAARSWTRFAWRARVADRSSAGGGRDVPPAVAGQFFFQIGSTAPPRGQRGDPPYAGAPRTDKERQSAPCFGSGRRFVYARARWTIAARRVASAADCSL